MDMRGEPGEEGGEVFYLILNSSPKVHVNVHRPNKKVLSWYLTCEALHIECEGLGANIPLEGAKKAAIIKCSNRLKQVLDELEVEYGRC